MANVKHSFFKKSLLSSLIAVSLFSLPMVSYADTWNNTEGYVFPKNPIPQQREVARKEIFKQIDAGKFNLTGAEKKSLKTISELNLNNLDNHVQYDNYQKQIEATKDIKFGGADLSELIKGAVKRDYYQTTLDENLNNSVNAVMKIAEQKGISINYSENFRHVQGYKVNPNDNNDKDLTNITNHINSEFKAINNLHNPTYLKAFASTFQTQGKNLLSALDAGYSESKAMVKTVVPASGLKKKVEAFFTLTDIALNYAKLSYEEVTVDTTEPDAQKNLEIKEAETFLDLLNKLKLDGHLKDIVDLSKAYENINKFEENQKIIDKLKGLSDTDNPDINHYIKTAKMKLEYDNMLLLFDTISFVAKKMDLQDYADSITKTINLFSQKRIILTNQEVKIARYQRAYNEGGRRYENILLGAIDSVRELEIAVYDKELKNKEVEKEKDITDFITQIITKTPQQEVKDNKIEEIKQQINKNKPKEQPKKEKAEQKTITKPKKAVSNKPPTKADADAKIEKIKKDKKREEALKLAKANAKKIDDERQKKLLEQKKKFLEAKKKHEEYLKHLEAKKKYLEAQKSAHQAPAQAVGRTQSIHQAPAQAVGRTQSIHQLQASVARYNSTISPQASEESQEKKVNWGGYYTTTNGRTDKVTDKPVENGKVTLVGEERSVNYGDYDYVGWGTWKEPSNAIGHFVYGKQTVELPKIGSASYYGEAKGLTVGRNKTDNKLDFSHFTKGNISLKTDFTNRNITGNLALKGLSNPNDKAKFILNPTSIDNASFKFSNVTGIMTDNKGLHKEKLGSDSYLQGSFYGDKAQEAGGVFSLNWQDKQNKIETNGIFRAKQQK